MSKTDDGPKYILCPTCGGGGHVTESRQVHYKNPDRTVTEQIGVVCKQCGGTGRVRG